MRGHRFLILALVCALPLATTSAQQLSRVYRSDTYLLLGGGRGNFEFTCDDPACVNPQNNSGDVTLTFGYHLRRKVRLEGTAHMQKDVDQNYASTLAAGLAYYVWRNAHVRGAAAWLAPDFSDATGHYTGRGTGFLAGAGYDLHVVHMIALTPYVTYASATIPTVTRDQLGTTSTTKGTAKVLNFGIGLTFVGGAWECTSRAGQTHRIKRLRRPSLNARMCLNEVEARLNGR